MAVGVEQYRLGVVRTVRVREAVQRTVTGIEVHRDERHCFAGPEVVTGVRQNERSPTHRKIFDVVRIYRDRNLFLDNTVQVHFEYEVVTAAVAHRVDPIVDDDHPRQLLERRIGRRTEWGELARFERRRLCERSGKQCGCRSRSNHRDHGPETTH